MTTFIGLTLALLAQQPDDAKSRSGTDKKEAREFVNQQIETVLNQKLAKTLPKEIKAQFPIRLQQRNDLTPQQHEQWVQSSPNRVTFAARLPKEGKGAKLKLLDTRAVGKRRYQFDLGVALPLRDVAIRLDVPPGGFIFDGIHTDVLVGTTVDFEWDYVGEDDERKGLFNFLNNRDIGLFPGGTADYLASSDKVGEQPRLLHDLQLTTKLHLRTLRISGIRGRLMYQNGRFVGGNRLWRFVAGAANFGVGIAEVASGENNLLERIVENAVNQTLYEKEPEIIALVNRELFVEENNQSGVKVKPFEILTETLPKQAIPSILPGKAN